MPIFDYQCNKCGRIEKDKLVDRWYRVFKCSDKCNGIMRHLITKSNVSIKINISD